MGLAIYRPSQHQQACTPSVTTGMYHHFPTVPHFRIFLVTPSGALLLNRSPSLTMGLQDLIRPAQQMLRHGEGSRNSYAHARNFPRCEHFCPIRTATCTTIRIHKHILTHIHTVPITQCFSVFFEPDEEVLLKSSSGQRSRRYQ